MNAEPPSPKFPPPPLALLRQLSSPSPGRRRTVTACRTPNNRSLIPPVLFWVFASALGTMLLVHVMLRFY